MRQTKSLITLFVLLYLVGISPASAAGWTVDYAHSKLGFIGTQGDTSFEGSFKSFETTIDFDPLHPETGKITAIIDTGSATAGSSERDEYLPQADWFNVKTFPKAQFVSTAIRKTGDDAYIADGTLTIKGMTKTVALPFTLTEEGDHWHAQGKLTLVRGDFNVGTGSWSSEAYVKHAVDVVVDLTAKPAT